MHWIFDGKRVDEDTVLAPGEEGVFSVAFDVDPEQMPDERVDSFVFTKSSGTIPLIATLHGLYVGVASDDGWLQSSKVRKLDELEKDGSRTETPGTAFPSLSPGHVRRILHLGESRLPADPGEYLFFGNMARHDSATPGANQLLGERRFTIGTGS